MKLYGFHRYINKYHLSSFMKISTKTDALSYPVRIYSSCINEICIIDGSKLNPIVFRLSSSVGFFNVSNTRNTSIGFTFFSIYFEEHKPIYPIFKLISLSKICQNLYPTSFQNILLIDMSLEMNLQKRFIEAKSYKQDLTYFIINLGII